ncbi:pyridoxamine 5'-phosphate oxidase family protein [Lysinibacillus fusiformis]|uniref:pyridoxamine 5'-phosphate oxidase family protein n=1 Tax=Lysinibacillus fusiformis TaxID=28031 RepID=UPI0000F36315|nr:MULTISPECIES: pyridoxamine 5'-phosphate oxidase family protein [Lysinibacillus]EAZ83724.1 general stress protein [Bacillus sp. B14905]MED4074959.1 pyridoxamine 5'-phosphate oxidase family protein [Lysinibacillus fusiformis]MED4669953.1 pyridoxamine 5'-phosphate oxidase family protein [Lysinibacillus fusiformis]NOG26851.1 pyridoxamine 5'-phosphate oxidase family protein [Lysinibacillus fusiformis]PCD82554.1 general stress protein [Lysinibacillus fusiformis]
MTSVREEILEVLNREKIGTMATVENGKPYSRYMTFQHEDFVLYTVTNKHSEKMEELRQNPYTHILYGYENGGFGDSYVEIEGKLTEVHEEGIKNKIAEIFTSIFIGNQDEMVTLKIEPIRMRLMNKKGQPPKELEFSSDH